MKQLPEPLRWSLFRLLEAFSEWRTPGLPLALTAGAQAPASAPRWLWVYCTSIGEMQALEPLVRRYASERGVALLLISNHPHYHTAYLAKFPQAWFAACGGQSGAVAQLLSRFPPAELWIGEIPCLLSDAPCRFSYAYVRALHRAGARISVINGWLYGEAPSARLDKLEKQWFEVDYLRRIDHFFLQTEDVAQRLRAAGVEADKLQVTGSVKFDQMSVPEGPAPHSPDWQTLLSARDSAGRRPLTLVAGCLTEEAEQRRVLDAFALLRTQHPEARLLIAPRHPEKPERMAALHALLQSYGLNYCFRTAWQQEPLESYAVLVLNTVGELRYFYALADVAHVGADHNVLEPLACGVPVTVSGEWHTQYPSYPIYLQCLAAGVIQSENEATRMASVWQRCVGVAQQKDRSFHALGGAQSRIQNVLLKAGFPERETNSVA